MLKKEKNELQKNSQGKNMAEEYVTWFKAITMVSGLDYPTWIMFFKNGLAGNLWDKIYNSEIVPGNDTEKDFQEWCKKACILDYNWQMACAEWGGTVNNSGRVSRSTQEKPVAATKPKFSRDPNAMDVDQAKREGCCFGCGCYGCH